MIKGYYFHHLYLTHNLLGDPSIDIWTDIPVKYTDAEIDVYRDEQTITVSGSCLDGAKIVVHTTTGNTLTKEGKASGLIQFSASPNSAIMIYNHNMIPYMPTLCLQNENITYSQHIFAKDVKMGSMVDGNRSYGNISFSNNVNYIIDATGDVEINPGFIVKNTGKVTIKTPGSVIIKGGTICKGGSLNINASNVIMDGNFISELGASINISENND